MNNRAVSRVLSVFVLCLITISAQPLTQVTSDSPEQAEVTTGITVPAASEPIIIDHTCTDFSQIPPYWIEQAKAMTFHYAHTSHGSQIVSGLEKLESVDSTYGFAVQTSSTVSLPAEMGVLRMYDGNNGCGTYVTPDGYWATTTGINCTYSVADTFLFDASMWSWCGQQSSNSETTVNTYLSTLALFDSQYPDIDFILMTGHTDGGSATLDDNNNLVRQYAQDHNMVLFDFADIETYDPLGGGPYDNNGEGTCTWCEDFCDTNPSYCTDLPSYCAHSSSLPDAELFCKLKGNAFWWMMARLAGWPGPVDHDLSASTLNVQPMTVSVGERMTYTVNIVPSQSATISNVVLTDTLPTAMLYTSGSMSATSGVIDDSSAPTLTWSSAQVTKPVTITYAVLVAPGVLSPYTVTNDVLIGATDIPAFTREVISLVNWQPLYLPMVHR